jgi:DNA-binding response OmpR family regulator
MSSTPGWYPAPAVPYPETVADVLIASDSPGIRDDIESVVGDAGTTVRWVKQGAEVLPAVAEREPDLVVLDLQIGNMGGMATCMELRLEESADRLPHIPVLMLLDRRPDVHLARRAEADGWLVKPLDPIRIRRATTELLAGRIYEDDSYLPYDNSHLTTAATDAS